MMQKRSTPQVFDLSIDFDFFIREKSEWDFGHREDTLGRVLWVHRYDHVDLWRETDPDKHADFQPLQLLPKLALKGAIFDKRNGRQVACADSHKAALHFFRNSRAPLLVNVDAHHDLFNGADAPLDCGNWIPHLLDMRSGLRIHQVYPKWKDPRGELDGLYKFRDSVTWVRGWDNWNLPAGEWRLGRVFICFSSAWVPPHHFPLFSELVETFGSVSGRRLIELDGGFPRLKPEFIPTRAENAKRVRAFHAQMRKLTTNGKEADMSDRTEPEYDIFHECPTCGAPAREPCRTPKGRKKLNVHDTRPFSITTTSEDK
jgi:hypothetical protein